MQTQAHVSWRPGDNAMHHHTKLSLWQMTQSSIEDEPLTGARQGQFVLILYGRELDLQQIY